MFGAFLKGRQKLMYVIATIVGMLMVMTSSFADCQHSVEFKVKQTTGMPDEVTAAWFDKSTATLSQHKFPVTESGSYVAENVAPNYALMWYADGQPYPISVAGAMTCEPGKDIAYWLAEIIFYKEGYDFKIKAEPLKRKL